MNCILLKTISSSLLKNNASLKSNSETLCLLFRDKEDSPISSKFRNDLNLKKLEVLLTKRKALLRLDKNPRVSSILRRLSRMDWNLRILDYIKDQEGIIECLECHKWWKMMMYLLVYRLKRGIRIYSWTQFGNKEKIGT
jgi:hypothetical protein